jgi:hypothetical protein
MASHELRCIKRDERVFANWLCGAENDYSEFFFIFSVSRSIGRRA